MNRIAHGSSLTWSWSWQCHSGESSFHDFKFEPNRITSHDIHASSLTWSWSWPCHQFSWFYFVFLPRMLLYLRAFWSSNNILTFVQLFEHDEWPTCALFALCQTLASHDLQDLWRLSRYRCREAKDCFGPEVSFAHTWSDIDSRCTLLPMPSTLAICTLQDLWELPCLRRRATKCWSPETAAGDNIGPAASSASFAHAANSAEASFARSKRKRSRPASSAIRKTYHIMHICAFWDIVVIMINQPLYSSNAYHLLYTAS